jgi:hypothetical protein
MQPSCRLLEAGRHPRRPFRDRRPCSCCPPTLARSGLRRRCHLRRCRMHRWYCRSGLLLLRSSPWLLRRSWRLQHLSHRSSNFRSWSRRCPPSLRLRRSPTPNRRSGHSPSCKLRGRTRLSQERSGSPIGRKEQDSSSSSPSVRGRWSGPAGTLGSRPTVLVLLPLRPARIDGEIVVAPLGQICHPPLIDLERYRDAHFSEGSVTGARRARGPDTPPMLLLATLAAAPFGALRAPPCARCFSISTAP